MESPPAPESERRRPRTAAASPPNDDQAGTGRHTLPLPPYVESGSSRKRKQTGTAIGDSFNAEVRQQADAHIARMFFTAGLPFNLARNPNFRAAI
ncbi:hypothetical protein ZWY2020_024938 [Hordeum vulgare]|nr:hypothetical protein ZWY2020_024938 [Hordeum vulgare]